MNELKIAQKGQCDNYSIFIASRYFETIEDYINLIMTTQRFKMTLEKYYYNPISLTKTTMCFFPNIETLHLYNENDELLEGGRIQWYVNWFQRIGYFQSLDVKEKTNKNIEFKQLIYTSEDKHKEYSKQKELHQINQQNNKELQLLNIIIPNGVTEIEKRCFLYDNHLKSIQLPDSLRILHEKQFNGCHSLSQINIPSSITSIGDFCFGFCSQLKEIIIPDFITSFQSNWFVGCRHLTKLILPLTIKDIPDDSLEKFQSLKSLQLSTEWKLNGDRLFREQKGCLHSIQLPTSLTILNTNLIELDDIKTFELTSSIKTLNSYCFAHCTELSEIHGLNESIEIGLHCFSDTPKLKKLPLFENYLKNEMKLTHQQLILLENWTSKKCKEILFDSSTSELSISNRQQLYQHIIGKENVLFLIENYSKDFFGYYLSGKIHEDYEKRISVGSESFEFRISSQIKKKVINKQKESLCSSPMKYEILDTRKGGYILYDSNDSPYILWIGSTCIYQKEHDAPSINQCPRDGVFNYYNQKIPLCVHSNETIKRLCILEMV